MEGLSGFVTVEYSLVNDHQSLNASNFIKLCNVSVPRDLLQASTDLEHTVRMAMPGDPFLLYV